MVCVLLRIEIPCKIKYYTFSTSSSGTYLVLEIVSLNTSLATHLAESDKDLPGVEISAFPDTLTRTKLTLIQTEDRSRNFCHMKILR